LCVILGLGLPSRIGAGNWMGPDPDFCFARIEILTVTVIICTRNRPACLRSCLEGVKALDPPADEILVVDNTTGDAETEAIAGQFTARYVVEPAKGLSRARNRGLAESRTDIVAYIDDDALPRREWLGRLIAPFDDAQVAAVTGTIVAPDSSGDEGALEPPLMVNDKVVHWFEIATFGGLGLGSNMALRKSACAGWTVFDVRLGRGGPIEIADENFAFASLLSRGYTGVHLPAAIVTHPRQRHDTQAHRARNSFAYWLLLYSAFPARRRDLRQFLFRRLRRERLGWQRGTQDPGMIISSSWWAKLKSGVSGLLLFLRTKK
jgi:O-antigen biosynthesis protein